MSFPPVRHLFGGKAVVGNLTKAETILLFCFLGCFSFLSPSCKDAGLQTPDKTFALSTEDASCTEVWLKIRIGAGITNREITLKRDSIALFTRTIHESETVLLDTNLLPSHTYAYTALLTDDSKTRNSTTQVQTMDTTSHNITWTTTTLGDGTGSSSLYDVTIINDSLAYAVGEIYQSGVPYNAAKWDGRQWELKRILFEYQGQQFYSEIYSVLAFAWNDIWFEGGIHWDGNQFVSAPMNIDFPSHVNRLWGYSSNDLYAVGNSGLIAHYDGSSWRKLESGTTLNIYDIYGSRDEILSVAANIGSSTERKIIKIVGTTVTSLSDSPIRWSLNSVWFVPDRHYYVVGDGVYEKHTLSDDKWKNGPLDITHYGTTKIRGNDINDVFAVGAYGECMHWNGANWKSYREVIGLTSGCYGGLALMDNIIITVGYNGSSAVATIGRRN